MRMKPAHAGLISLVVLAAIAAWLFIGRQPAATPSAPIAPSAIANSAVKTTAPASDARSTADKALAALQAHDGPALAALVHPNGVRLSPSGFVDVDADQVLMADEVAVLWQAPALRVWGTAEASGDPIDLTAAAYADRYIVDHDYRGTSVSINRDGQRGTTADNAAAVYPGATRIEYLRQGAEATDWSALKLVLLPVDGEWRLVGIIHDEWTP